MPLCPNCRSKADVHTVGPEPGKIDELIEKLCTIYPNPNGSIEQKECSRCREIFEARE